MYHNFILDRGFFSGLIPTIILLLISVSCLSQNDRNDTIIKVKAFLATNELYKLINMQNNKIKTIEETKEYIGMWVTEDGYIHHELLPNNRYDEARGERRSAYQGTYLVSGNHIDYKDDTGFTADGEFKEGILYHAGMVLYKKR